MYEEQFGHTVIEEVVEKEGIEFTLTRGSPPSISTFEQALEEIKSVYEAQFGHSVAEDVFENNGIECSFTRGCLHRSSYIAGMKADYYRYIAELRTRVLNLLRYPAIWCP